MLVKLKSDVLRFLEIKVPHVQAHKHTHENKQGSSWSMDDFF